MGMIQELNEERVIELLKECKDPELGIDVWTLGLIYEIKVTSSAVKIKMTLTSPTCPFGQMMISEIKDRLKLSGGASEVDVELTFNPPWEPPTKVRTMLGI
ncbi:MAG: aromatic ring hydroxylase [Euryarchaeota archaeon]|jgi:metal-sulfur cluster biosynthetic enzyme|nr:aromatic ring hydroxylase [Euryarchaeota archaeon]HIK01321.1 metal-sulfur cluster assembly factor [Candidatus Undinarchaeales archaeon ERR594346 U_76725]|tara:strand:+ start:60725 stop:61027 length:303 start_codon:yes stop_codon:yes gene_type:complete